jgi:Group II intron, maturase-specific domain
MLQHARNWTRELTDRRRLLVPVDDVVQDVNRFLHEWSGYFRYGNSARQFNDINLYALTAYRSSLQSATRAAGGMDGRRSPTNPRTASV